MPRATDRKAAIDERIAASKKRQAEEKQKEVDARDELHRFLGEIAVQYGMGSYTESEIHDAFAMIRDVLKGNALVSMPATNGHALARMATE